MELSEILKVERERAGLSRQQLADKAGVSLSFIRDVEQGVRVDITWLYLQKIAAALGVSCEVFKTLPESVAPADPPTKAMGKRK